MPGGIPRNATCTFNGATMKVVSLSVESPQAEVVDMTSATDGASTIKLVPTGAWTGGSITVEYIYESGDPQTVVKTVGSLSFTSQEYTVTRRAILVSATVDSRVGEVVRGTLRFQLTDYQGS